MVSTLTAYFPNQNLKMMSKMTMNKYKMLMRKKICNQLKMMISKKKVNLNSKT